MNVVPQGVPEAATKEPGLVRRPCWTVAASEGLAVASYLVELLGTALGLPAAVLGLSAFHHVPSVPVEGFSLLPTSVLTGLGLLAAGTGIAAFRRRDVTGG